MLPSLINTGPVKARLMAELRRWTGGEVTVAGPVSIESFFSLSVDLRNVEFGGVEGVSNITSVKAARIIARISWANLLIGNLDFDKIRIFDAVIHAKGGNRHEIGGALLASLTGAHKIPFAALSLVDSAVIIEGAAQQPSRRLQIETASANLRMSDGRIGVTGTLKWKGEPIVFRVSTNLPARGKPDVPVPMILNVDSRLVSGGFNGETSLNGALNAAGYLSLTTPDLPGLAKWSGFQLEDGMPGVVQLTGSLNLAPDWVSLQAAAFAVAGQRATGDLTLKFAAEQPQLEGALAFDELDLDPLWSDVVSDRPGDADTQSVSRRVTIRCRSCSRDSVAAACTADLVAATRCWSSSTRAEKFMLPPWIETNTDLSCCSATTLRRSAARRLPGGCHERRPRCRASIGRSATDTGVGVSARAERRPRPLPRQISARVEQALKTRADSCRPPRWPVR